MTRPPTTVSVIGAPRGIVRSILRADGTVRAVRREFLSFEQTGRVELLGRAEDGAALRAGQRVTGPSDGQPGQLLARVDARDQAGDVVLQEVGVRQSQQDVKSASAQVSQAKSDLTLAKARLTRTEGLYQAGDSSLAQLEEARAGVKAARATLKARRAALSATKAGVTGAKARLGKAEVQAVRTEIRAPFDGILAAVNVRVGDYATQGMVDRSSESRQLATAPFTVIDTSEYEVTVELPAFEAEQVRPGQMVAVMDPRTELGPPKGKSPSELPISLGRVYSVANAIDPESRTVQVRLRTRHNPHLLRHGQFVTCIIITAERRDVVVLPLDVILFRDNRPHVYAVDEATGTVARREITPGLRGPRTMEVASGVTAGEKLVVDGRFRLTPGTRVEIVRTDVADIGWQGDPPDLDELKPKKPKKPKKPPAPPSAAEPDAAPTGASK